MNPCSNHPPSFPPWHGKLSPVIDPREKDIESARWRMGVIAIFVASGFIWAIIFACARALWLASQP